MPPGFIETTVTKRHVWAEGLITLTFAEAMHSMKAGQFANIGRLQDGEVLRRSYSVASAPGEATEVYVTLVADGALTPFLFDLRVGDSVLLDPKAHGVFTLDYVPTARDLWLVSTGTGLGPYISMLRAGVPFERFERVIVVHGTRLGEHLSYQDELRAAGERFPGRVEYVPIVSREQVEGALFGRITTALTSGQLEERVGLPLSAEHSHVMLCGNPDMVTETIALLDARGLKKHRAKTPGHVTMEKYW